MKKTVLIVSVLLALLTVQGFAAGLSLPDIFAAEMVLQRQTPIRVWGGAASNVQIQVELILVDTNGVETVCASSSVSSDVTGAWEVLLTQQPATPEGAHHILSVVSGAEELRRDPVYVGDVWICSGQSNMNFLMRPNLPWSGGVLDWETEVAAAGDPQLNVFTVIPEADWKPLDEVHGTWRPDTQTYAAYFSAIPYLFGREIRREAGVPVGIIVAALGATSISSWMPVAAQADIPDAQSLIALHAGRLATYTNEIAAYYQNVVPAYRTQSIINQLQPTYAAAYGDPENYPTWRDQPGGLYNGMLAPIEKFSAKGVVWYQGESDSTGYQTYFEYLSALIASWRELRAEPDLPFLIVQLPNYDPVANGSDPATYDNVWAGLREAQEQALSISNVAVIVTADVGESLVIHYRNKQPVAYRLGLAALKTAYGQTNLVASGPRFQSLQLAGSELKVLLTDEGSGLEIDLNRASGDGPSFEVAGPDRVFYTAQYRLSGDSIYLSSPNVAEPIHARYAYHNDPKLILYNTEGLPAFPFRASPVLEGLVNFTMDASNLTPTGTNSTLTSSGITFGPGVTASGYGATRGTPPPSFFVRTTSTPSTQQGALDAGCYMEVRIAAYSAYRLLPSLMSFSFDIARSTTVGTFYYAVRSSIDNFSADLCQAEILTINETFSTVEVPAPDASGGPVQEIAYRIYFWDNLNDSTRVVRIDTLKLSGLFLFSPQVEFGQTEGVGSLRMQWNSVPGRIHVVYRTDSLLQPRDLWIREETLPATAEGLSSYIVSNANSSGFFYIQ